MVSVTSLHAQTTDPTFPVNGTHDKALVATVLEHATLHLDAETTLEDGTVILHRGRIVAAGPSATTSFDGPAMRLDMTGLHLYPSFVDVHSDLGTPEAQSAGWSRTPKTSATKKGRMAGTKRCVLRRPPPRCLTHLPRRRNQFERRDLALSSHTSKTVWFEAQARWCFRLTTHARHSCRPRRRST